MPSQETWGKYFSCSWVLMFKLRNRPKVVSIDGAEDLENVMGKSFGLRKLLIQSRVKGMKKKIAIQILEADNLWRN